MTIIEPETTAEEPPYIGTELVHHRLHGPMFSLVIPKDVTALEATCWATFLVEQSQRHLIRGWNMEQRLTHYKLTRFLVEGDKS